jgi:hypothetical protein
MSRPIVRPATPEDMPAIRRCYSEVESPIGGSLDEPQIGDRSTLECFVVEKDGEIIGGLYLEKCVRISFLGASEEALAALRGVQEQIFASSADAGVAFIHCLVPTGLTATTDISRHLQSAGFDRCYDLVDHVLNLRQCAQPCDRTNQIEVGSPHKWAM